MTKQRVKFYASDELSKFIELQGKPKEIENLISKIHETYGNDKEAFKTVQNLLDNDMLVIFTKMFKGVAK